MSSSGEGPAPGGSKPPPADANPVRLSLARRLARTHRPRWLRNAWFAARYFLGSHRLTFPLLKWAPAPYPQAMVTARSNACIDGLPRSANTFGAMVFLEQNPGVALAHHIHLPAQVARAIRLGVPCCVLIRPPIDNLASMAIALDNQIAHDLLFRTYLHYLGWVEAVREKVVLCTFDEVLAEPNVIARRLNEVYGTAFEEMPFTQAQTESLVSAMGDSERLRPGHVPVPNAFKEDRKPAIKRALSAHRQVPEAEALYERLAATVR